MFSNAEPAHDGFMWGVCSLLLSAQNNIEALHWYFIQVKLEQDIKELEHCTFRPKTNLLPVKSSISQICKKQLEYVKSRNTVKMRTKITQNPIQTPKNVQGPKGKDPGIHDRLYKDSKIFQRGKLQRTIN